MDLNQKDWWESFLQNEYATIIDVRTDEEVGDGIVPGAIQIDISKGQGFISEIEQLPKDREYFVYCKLGGRSAQACGIMQQLGFEKVNNLLGGFSQWDGPIGSLK